MRLSSVIISAVAFVLAGALCLVAAGFAVTAIEDNSEIVVRRALDASGNAWAEVQADGLQVTLTGTAPDEARRFNAISSVGSAVDAARIIDAMEVTPTAELAPPRFSAEILRNESGISIIGLVPSHSDREGLIEDLAALAGKGNVADFLETAAYPVPTGWNDALAFAVDALERLPRSKVSVDAGFIAITAAVDSSDAKRNLETELTRAVPAGLRFALNITAPRPVITPFTLRFLIDESGARFDACSADSEASRDKIIAAAVAAGLEGKALCTIGMGVPSPNWSKASELSIAALAELGAGSVTISNADISLIVPLGTSPTVFDRVVGELEAELPEVFALFAVLPEPEDVSDAGPSEFVATLSPEGLVQLRGRLNDESLRHVADSYAKARFGSANVYTAARIVGELPADWPVRVLAGLEALSMLTNGAVTVTPDDVSIRGISAHEEISADIARMLSEQLGESEAYTLDITYRAPPPPADAVLDPEVCEAEIAGIQKIGKIDFEPGSATIAAESQATMDAITKILEACGEIRMEIQGHTDSQGRESMNQKLSQARAQSVLNELRARRVLTATYVAVGYGETLPIASNKTEAGRDENRRIEFRLIRPEPIKDTQTTLEAVEQLAPSDPVGAEDVTGSDTPAQGTDPADRAETNSGEGPVNEQN